MRKFFIQGGPGTGKTQFLVTLMEKVLAETTADRVAFVSFTRAGTYAGVNRVKEKYNLSDEDLRYFRTIHSLCYYLLGKPKVSSGDEIRSEVVNFMGKQDLLTLRDAELADFFRRLAQFESYKGVDDYSPAYIQANKIMDWNETNDDVLIYEGLVEKLREEYGVLSFDNLLTEALERCEPLDIDYAFVDEVQDLTSVQWDVVHKLFSHAHTVYYAGDFNQCVNECFGSSKILLAKEVAEIPKKNIIMLDKTFRCSECVWDLVKLQYTRFFGQPFVDYAPIPDKGNGKLGWSVVYEPGLLPNVKQSAMYGAIDWCLDNHKSLFCIARTNKRLCSMIPYLVKSGASFTWSRTTSYSFRYNLTGITSLTFPSSPIRRITKWIVDTFYNERLFTRWRNFLFDIVPRLCTEDYDGQSWLAIARRFKKVGFNAPMGNTRRIAAQLLWYHQSKKFLTNKPISRQEFLWMVANIMYQRDFNDPSTVRVATVNSLKGEEADVVIYDRSYWFRHVPPTPDMMNAATSAGLVALSRAREGVVTFADHSERDSGIALTERFGVSGECPFGVQDNAALIDGYSLLDSLDIILKEQEHGEPVVNSEQFD